MTKSDDYLWDKSGEPDADVARLESLLSPLKHDAPLDELRMRQPSKRGWILVSGLVAAAAAVVLVVVLRPRPEDPQATACAGGVGFAFSAQAGTVSCNGTALASGVLPVGGTLDTGTQKAELAIANIGRAQLGAETVIRLDRTELGTRHQLHLERGHMHAKVDAKPKIFAVTTPSADVTDLGCEYEIDLDRSGAGSIHVISGKVELETGKHQPVVLLAGMHARLLPGRRAGLALSDKAGAAMEQAAADYDAGKPDALARVLVVATRDDVITLQRLALVLPRAQVRQVLEKLQTLFPIPQNTTLDDVLADTDLLEMWLDDVELSFVVSPR
jgi:ferric-dicitrate binding protein FerR (iron transport regulator)